VSRHSQKPYGSLSRSVNTDKENTDKETASLSLAINIRTTLSNEGI